MKSLGIPKFLFLLLITCAIGKALPRSRRQSDAECTPLYVDSAQCSKYWSGQKPPLLVVSFDGFRYNYINRSFVNEKGVEEPAAPNINRLAQCGVWASSGIVPAFPTVTYPNHWSLVTGLYPASHGIVDNNFYDSELNATFSLTYPTLTNPLWWKGEPVWYTAKRQGKISASYFWPGSDLTDPIREPNYWKSYNVSVPYADRATQVVNWLMLPAQQRPNLITLYHDEPDYTAHYESPDSPLLVDKIRVADQQVKFLLEKLEEVGILGCVDLIVLSDHGMASTPLGEKFLLLDDYVPNIGNDTLIYDEVFPAIRPKNDSKEEQDRIAHGLECKDPNMRVYNKWDFPRRHRYAENIRIPSLLLDLTVTWRAFINKDLILTDKGGHGYDNLNMDMLALFVAQGPSFRRKLEVRPFLNIELYNLICELLEIKPALNNGTWGALHHILVSPPTDPPTDPISTPSTFLFPQDEVIYNNNLQRNKCTFLTGSNSLAIDLTLNLTAASIQEALLLHTPWGSPQSSNNNSNIRVIINKDFVLGFDVEAGETMWTSYTLKQPQLITSSLLWRLDPRLEKNQKSLCDRLSNGIDDSSNLLPFFPFGSGANAADVAVDTNAVEVSSRFFKYWTDFHAKLTESIAENGETNVIVGPVRDSVSPALFFIVSNCKNLPLAQCPIDQLDQQSFIFPTYSKYNRDCVASEEFFSTNLAMLRDVEHVSNLQFFPLLPYRHRTDLLSRTCYASLLLANH